MTTKPNTVCVWQINLFLRVVRRREDGYHDLASLFHVRGHHCAPLELSKLPYGWCARHRKRCHDVQMHALHGKMQVIDLGDTMDFNELPVGERGRAHMQHGGHPD